MCFIIDFLFCSCTNSTYFSYISVGGSSRFCILPVLLHTVCVIICYTCTVCMHVCFDCIFLCLYTLTYGLHVRTGIGVANTHCSPYEVLFRTNGCSCSHRHIWEIPSKLCWMGAEAPASLPASSVVMVSSLLASLLPMWFLANIRML